VMQPEIDGEKYGPENYRGGEQAEKQDFGFRFHIKHELREAKDRLNFPAWLQPAG